MKVTASLAISSIVVGVDPLEAPTPRLSKVTTRCLAAQAAGRRFKQDGIDGAGVAAVMSDAGLTNGASYAQFTSEEDLVANVLADQPRAQRQSLDSQPQIRRDSRRSSAPICLPNTATSAPTAARRLRCSTRSPDAPPPPDRSSPPTVGWLKCLTPLLWKRTLCAAQRVRNASLWVASSPTRSERSRLYGSRPAAERRMATVSVATRSQSP
jgi:AcrR family transcriptional regulator